MFKVAAAYAIMGWLLAQIASVFFPILLLPDWILRAFVVLLVLGFPVALLLAWAYEVTPSGIQLTARAPGGDTSPPASAQRLNAVLLGLLVIAVAFLVVDAYVLDGTGREATPRETSRNIVRLSINPSPGESWVISPHDADFAVAPDGMRIAYIGRRAGVNHVVVRRLDEFEGRSLGGFGGAVRSPFFSPDGAWIGFVDGNVLKKVSVRDGTTATVAVLPSSLHGAVWGRDDRIVFGTLRNGLFRVPASGGEPEVVPTTLGFDRYPELLPENRGLLFASETPEGTEVRVRSLETGAEKTVVSGATFPKYAATGHLLYVSDSVLWAAAFDLDELELAGAPVPIVDGVMIKGPRQFGFGAANIAIAGNGTLVYRSVGREGHGTSTLVWVDRQGNEEPLDLDAQAYGRMQLSSDGERIAIEVTDANLTNTDIWVGRVTDSALRRLTFDPALNAYPVWSPDGSRIAFSAIGDDGGLFSRSADGAGAAERLVGSDFFGQPWFAMPNGEGLVFSGSANDRRDFYLVPFTGGGAPARLDLHHGPVAAISADGNWIAYSSDETGDFEIYVQPYPNPAGEKWRITSTGGRDPVFSHDGSELYFQNGTTVFAVAISTEPAFSVSPPVTLFDGPYIDSRGRWYDVAPDGRFLMIKPGWLRADTDTPINVVLNWFEELARVVPIDD